MFRARTHPHIVAEVRAKLHDHPVVDDFAKRYRVDREHAENVVTESVLDAMDMLGSAYVTRMTQVVDRITVVRQAIHVVYERVLNGHTEVDAAALRRKFDELHAATTELADPKTWAEREGAALEPLAPQPEQPRPAPPPVAAEPGTTPPVAGAPSPESPGPARRSATPQYPGARPGLAGKPSRAPRPGQPIVNSRGARTGTWREEVKRTGDITLELDAEGLYWKFPDLQEGVVLHFPEYGYRVWKEPRTGAIVEELIVGPSVTKARRFTRGEDVLFSAADVSEAYRSARTERAHGAGAPGLGFDAQYGVAHAVRRINQWLENRGVEQWVRNLRDNAEPGVEYVWTTKTETRRQTLASREYTISAIVDGTIYELYVFKTTMPAGSPLSDTSVQFDVVGVSPAAELYGAPLTRESRAALEAAEPGTSPAVERVTPPDVVVEALARTRRSMPELAHPAAARSGKRLESLARLIEGRLLEHASRSRDVALVEAIDGLANAIQDLHRDIASSAPDPVRLARIDAAIMKFAQRAGRWTDHVTADDVRALLRQLKALRRG